MQIFTFYPNCLTQTGRLCTGAGLPLPGTLWTGRHG